MEKAGNALIVWILVGILVAVFGFPFFLEEEPCPLCYLQRLCMLGVGSGLALNLRFGIIPSHYGISLCSALIGSGIALRQIALHVCPEFPIFGEPFLGLSLYMWSFLIFSCSILGIALLLFLYDPKRQIDTAIPRWQSSASYGLFFVAVANTLAVWQQCSWGSCE